MRIHYFQHDYFEDLGYIGDWAKEKNFETSVTRFDLGDNLPANHSYDWLVILGGKMSVNDQEKYPWIKSEVAFIHEAIQLGKIVIGICLGSQLVAKATGAKVFKNSEPEMGFWPVNLSENAAGDTIFRHFPKQLDVMHMHFDTFSLPEGAINMANSAVTDCQAFRIGRNVFALQFHFEVTPGNVAIFIKEIAPEIVTGKYSQTPEEMNSLTNCCEGNNMIFKKMLDEIYSSNEYK